MASETCVQLASSVLECTLGMNHSLKSGRIDSGNLTESSVASSLVAGAEDLAYDVTDRGGKMVARILKKVPYMRIFEWEKIDVSNHVRLAEDYWMLSVVASVCYLGLIFYGKYWMRNRQAMELRGPLVIWNFSLALFSFVGVLRTLPELWVGLQEENGFHNSVCSNIDVNAATAIWSVLMLWSKVVELGDTAFLVLKKRPVIFLHWYHHITVLVYMWFTFSSTTPSKKYFMTMNMFVHALMYAYFALRAMRVKVNEKIAMAITIAQCSQMGVGVFINMYLFSATRSGNCPAADVKGMYAALSMYGTYLILFSNFFYQAYFGKRKKE